MGVGWGVRLVGWGWVGMGVGRWFVWLYGSLYRYGHIKTRGAEVGWEVRCRMVCVWFMEVCGDWGSGVWGCEGFESKFDVRNWHLDTIHITTTFLLKVTTISLWETT